MPTELAPAQWAPFPDVEQDLRPVLAPLVGGIDHTGSVTPSDLAQWLPFCQIVRYGGSDDGVTDSAAVDVDFYAATRAQAVNLARRAHQLLTAGRLGSLTTLIDTVTTTVGVVERPREGGIRRFGGSYTVSARRTPA